jgi:GT2 family glycosyltransferase
MLSDYLTIIVVTYNSMEIFPEFISSLYISLTKEECTVIVIDNNSQDNIEKFLNENYPKVKLLKSIKNEGYGAGINKGIAAAKTPFVAIMNPDVIVKEGGFTELVNFLKENHLAAGVSGALFHLKQFNKKINFDELIQKNKITVNQKFLKLIYRALYYSGIKTKFRKLKFLSPWSFINAQDSIRVTRLNGSFGVFRKNALIEVNMFDSRLFLYFEEDDIALRLTRAGYSLYVTNRTVIIHTPGMGSSQSNDLISDKILLNSQYIYFKKHYGIIYAWISFITIWSILTTVMVYQLIFNYNESKKTITLWKWHLHSLLKGGGLPKGTIPNGGKDGINYTWTR